MALCLGPDIRWIGRHYGRRQDRRWARSWSPEQIANRLVLDFPDDSSMRISQGALGNVSGRRVRSDGGGEFGERGSDAMG